MAYSAKDPCPPLRFLYLTETKSWSGKEKEEKEEKEKKSVWRPTLLQGAWVKNYPIHCIWTLRIFLNYPNSIPAFPNFNFRFDQWTLQEGQTYFLTRASLISLWNSTCKFHTKFPAYGGNLDTEHISYFIEFSLKHRKFPPGTVGR